MGLLSRLFGAAAETHTTSHTHVQQNFKVKVPAEHAGKVASALERWLASKGSSTLVGQKPDGDKMELTFQRSDDRDGPLDVDSSELAAELQRVIEQALR